MIRLSFAGSRGASRSALARASPHLLLGEGKGRYLATFLTPVKYTAAQERQFLYLDAIPSDQSEVGSHRTFGTQPVLPNAFKGEHPESRIVSESGENELHLVLLPKLPCHSFG
jgi:hypothetical protein